MNSPKTANCRQGTAAASFPSASTQGPDLRAPPENATVPAAGGAATTPYSLPDVLAYQRDVWERWILFIGTLRQRADDLLAHDRAGGVPVDGPAINVEQKEG